MPSLVTRMILIFILTFIFQSIRLATVNKPVKNRVEMPSKIQRIGYRAMVVLPFIVGAMALFGLVMRETEMTIVSTVMAVIFGTLVYFTRRKFKRFYKETDEHFILQDEYRMFEVDYNNITDWILFSKHIGVLDQTQPENKYICVNLRFSDPEILLSKLAEMIFSGQFKTKDESQTEENNREQEFINHLQKHGYGHIVKEFLAE